MQHWENNKVWTHLEWSRHQARLRACSEACEGAAFYDVGCAFGHSTAIMAGFKPGAWAGVDFSRVGINKAKELYPQTPFHYLQNINDLPSLPCVDSVVCSEVIEHVEDPALLVSGLKAIARKRVVLTTPSKRVSDPGHLRVYDLLSLSAVLGEEHPFSIELLLGSFWIAVINMEEEERCR